MFLDIIKEKLRKDFKVSDRFLENYMSLNATACA